MTNTELIATQPNNLTVNSNVSPWRQFADQELKGNFAGELLKFAKGEWLLGESKTKIGATVPFVVNVQEMWVGWVRWWDGSPTDHLIGRVTDRFTKPQRDALGDTDKTQWESEKNGTPRDPWTPTVYAVLRNAETDELVTFTSSSDGGRRALAKLADRYDRDRSKYPGKYPVVVLGCESYQHKEYGKIEKPLFKIVDWQFWDEEAEKNAADEQPKALADDMNDEVPF